MYIFFEYAACLVLVALVATLLFAGCALLIILQEGAAIWRGLARRITLYTRILVARPTEFIRNGLSVAGFRLWLNQHADLSVSRRSIYSRYEPPTTI